MLLIIVFYSECMLFSPIFLMLCVCVLAVNERYTQQLPIAWSLMCYSVIQW